jgi:hypothetical protein
MLGDGEDAIPQILFILSSVFSQEDKRCGMGVPAHVQCKLTTVAETRAIKQFNRREHKDTPPL